LLKSLVTDRVNSSVFSNFPNSVKDGEERITSNKPFQILVAAAENDMPLT